MKLAEILNCLQEPLPKAVISSKTIKGQSIPYVSWYDLADLLDARAWCSWEWQIISTSTIGSNLVLVGSLTIHGDDGSRTMQATGCEELTVNGYGDPSSNAEAMAFRRAAAKFGLGRELWRKSKPQSALQSTSRKGNISREEWLSKHKNKTFGMKE